MFLFYLLLTLTNIIFIKNEKLIFVETLSRHGARAPLKTNDTGIDLMGIKWDSPGELTALGKRMEYVLGLYNRKKYIIENEFLSKKYDPHELIVFSSDVNRTLLSMTSQLQGLYQPSNDEGNILKPGQYDIESFPPFNLTIDDFKDEIKNLNDSALPNYMNIIPIHWINLINSTTECTDRLKEFSDMNAQKDPFISKFTEEFNKNYSTILNKLYHKPLNSTYDYALIHAIFDTIIVDTTEGNNITGFFEITGIDMDYFMSLRFEILTVFFRDFIFGDDKNEVILFYNSPLFKDMLNYMKRRIDDDINFIKINQSLTNVSDFSRPKMVIVSAHDITLSAIEMFFIRFFDINIKKFEFPVYTSQITYEITRDNDENVMFHNLTYSDYCVSYYFNEKLILNITFDKFIEKIESVTWKQKEMDKFCFGTITKKKKFFTTNIIIMMIMGLLILILIIIIIILIVKLSKKSKHDSWLDNDKAQKYVSDEKIINDEEE